LSVKHEVGDIVPDTFDVLIMAVSFQAKVYTNDEMHAIMKGKQFPLTIAIVPRPVTNCRVQHCGKSLAVFEQIYGQNWMYVVSLHVCTMKGLILDKATQI
jgi:hypothetical protein